jgi:UDP-glucose 4-epimerase
VTARLVWVVGRGGMLGGAVESRLQRYDVEIWKPEVRVPWDDPVHATAVLLANVHAFTNAAAGRPRTVYWCAGAGVTATGASSLSDELTVFQRFLDTFDNRADATGSLVLASSAGGVYAGAESPPFDESSPPRPLAPYGHVKLAMEHAGSEWARSTGGRVLIARLANLYGPGQDITKPQGLVSQLLRSHLLRQPLQVYVPLETARDYIYIDDAAARVVAASTRAEGGEPGSITVKIVASQQGLSVATVLGELRRVLLRRPPIVLGSSPVSHLQARDLRLRSIVWTDLDCRPLTPFPAGVMATHLDLTRQLQQGRLQAQS